MQLVIAEKPSVARDLARVLGVRPVGRHAFPGDHHVITWCVGHLVELDEPAAYDPRWQAWRLDTLPMLPAEFRLRPAKHAAAQLTAVVGLLGERRFASVVNACDAGREGELIFRYVYRFAGARLPVHRLWISSLTDDAIRRGFAALRPAAQLDALGDAARCRSEADWLVGMNATRAVTARGRLGGGSALYSIGRVQTPTLAMLVARELAIRAFVPRPYWELRAELRTAAGERFVAGWRYANRARLATAELAEAVATRDRLRGRASDPLGPRVERLRARTVREPPPLLFDLTSLQRTANRRFGLSAARTLELAQALYERHKVLTYPRTDSRHLSSDLVAELPALFAALATLPDYADFAAELVAHPRPPGRRVVDDAKVHDHHAIIPTGTPPRGLDRDEQRVFDLAVRRFLGAFYPDAEFAVTEAWIRVGPPTAELPAWPATPPANAEAVDGEVPTIEALPPEPDRYFARGRVRLVAGWQAVAGIDGGDAVFETRRDGDGRDLPTPVLPALVEGQPLDGEFAPIAKHTTPPRRFTEATLLGAMESAGKAIDDEALRAAMKDCGLGTPATRASIIETLLRRDYIVRDRQALVPTPMGLGLIAALPVASLASAELTGSWEARLARIARGEDSRDAFMADIARYVADTVDAIRGAAPPSGAPSTPRSPAPNGASAPPSGAPPAPSTPRLPAPNGASAPPRSPPAPSTPRSPAPNGASAPPRSPPAPNGPPAPPQHASRNRSSMAPAPRDPRIAASQPDDRANRPARVRRDVATAPVRTPSVRTAGRDQAVARSERSRPSDLTSRETRAPRSKRGRRGESAGPARTPRDHPPRPNLAGPARLDDLACPRCRAGVMLVGARGWGCSRWRDGCGFVVWFETAGRQLSTTQLRDLIVRGKTRKARFVADGVETDGRLVLDPSHGARFEPA